jgi:DNA-binding HxlR family transcriptional regulator
MTTADREQLRLALLRHLESHQTRFGLGTRLLRAMTIAEGLPATVAEVDAELTYLEDKGLVARIDKRISPELATWRITAAGRDYNAEHEP